MTAQVAEFQIPRNSLAWMLLAQIAVIAPHVSRLALWIQVVCVLCVLWRVMVYLGRWSYPGRWTKTLFVIGGMIGVPIGYRSIVGLEPAVALLIVAFVLKLLEMQHKRDAYIVIYLAYFVTVTEFLFLQTIPVTIYMVTVLVLITAALIGLNQTRGHLKPLHTLRLSMLLLGQSIPLMLVLFVLFPRVAPLWTVPLQSRTAKTGVSDSMSPGDIAQLSRSDELAFRVTFNGEIPPTNHLYWRGLVLTDLDGATWRQTRTGYGPKGIEFANQMDAPWEALIERRGDITEYSVIIEPTYQNWLFALATPVPLTEGTGLVRDFRLFATKPVQNRFRYEVRSYLDYSVEKQLSPLMRYRMTLLPLEGNPKTRGIAKALLAESKDTPDLIRKILTRFSQEEFVYTLRPPLLGENNIDEFLTVTRRGFCEHYAGSFVYLMRAAGIPARVVVGYQGGEYNPVGNYIAVHQFDAHAWAEVWIEGEGWRRVDPTSAVAPDRIEKGLEAAVSEEDSFLEDSPLSWLKYRQSLWLTDLRLQLDAIGLYWDAWIVGYNPTMQIRLLEQYIGKVSTQKIALALLIAAISIVSLMSIVLLSKSTTRTLKPIEREYLRYCKLLENRGVIRRKAEGPWDFARRVGSEQPDLAGVSKTVADIYVRLNYAEDDTVSLADMKRAITSFRLRGFTENTQVR